MDDRELLEKAAKAAGIVGRYFHSDNPIHCGIYWAHGEYYWNPLISNSEALRLAVTLGFGIGHYAQATAGDKMAAVVFTGLATPLIAELHGTDPLAATRRAIVRAAAALSENKQ